MVLLIIHKIMTYYTLTVVGPAAYKINSVRTHSGLLLKPSKIRQSFDLHTVQLSIKSYTYGWTNETWRHLVLSRIQIGPRHYVKSLFITSNRFNIGGSHCAYYGTIGKSSVINNSIIVTDYSNRRHKHYIVYIDLTPIRSREIAATPMYIIRIYYTTEMNNAIISQSFRSRWTRQKQH